MAENFIFPDDEQSGCENEDLDPEEILRRGERRRARARTFNMNVRIRKAERRMEQMERQERPEVFRDGRRLKFEVVGGSTFGKPRKMLTLDEWCVDMVRRFGRIPTPL